MHHGPAHPDPAAPPPAHVLLLKFAIDVGRIQRGEREARRALQCAANPENPCADGELGGMHVETRGGYTVGWGSGTTRVHQSFSGEREREMKYYGRLVDMVDVLYLNQ